MTIAQRTHTQTCMGSLGANRTLFLRHISHNMVKRVDVLGYRGAGGAATHSDPNFVPLKVPPIPQGGLRASMLHFMWIRIISIFLGRH